MKKSMQTSRKGSYIKWCWYSGNLLPSCLSVNSNPNEVPLRLPSKIDIICFQMEHTWKLRHLCFALTVTGSMSAEGNPNRKRSKMTSDRVGPIKSHCRSRRNVVWNLTEKRNVIKIRSYSSKTSGQKEGEGGCEPMWTTVDGKVGGSDINRTSTSIG